jgi:peptide/nickel transport system ATP-binding protein
MSDLVQVTGLNVVARDKTGHETPIVKNVSFSLARGEVLALIGESGSGKTTIALSLMGHARTGCRIDSGTIRIGDTNVLSLDPEQLPGIRGSKVAYIAQSAAAAFNPSRTIMHQVIESAVTHGLMTRADAERKAVELFRSLALPDPDHIGSRYPHQVSGGQLQRLMAAMALITDPALVILDEPTTALDVTTQIEVLRAFKKIVRERGTTAVYVSHDLAVVAQMADRIVVLNRGEIREVGTTEQIIEAPADSYTKELMAAAHPTLHALSSAPSEPERTPPLLEVRNLAAGYGALDRHGVPSNLILNDISLSIERGASLGVIGESGSGKSTLARVIAGLVKPVRGTVLFNGKPLPDDLKQRTRDQFRRIQIVFQNADTAMNPSHTVHRILARPLEFYHDLKGAAQDRRVTQLLDQVRLPAEIASRRSSELSGGQKQRINLARALAAEPDLILCDEITSALDTVVGAAILDLMAELRRELNISYLFISHSISTVRAVCDDIVVLYAGRKVESGATETLLAPPFHPYTDLLISSVPELRRGWLEQTARRRELPAIGAVAEDKRNSPELCKFLQRCPARIDGICNTRAPLQRMIGEDKQILCHHDDADLRRLLAKAVAGEEVHS